jgi:hypothetical protein
MKSIFKYVFPILLCLMFGKISAQVIDLRTGRDNINGLLIPVNSPDDTWQVSFGYISQQAPLPTLYFPVNVGTGTLLNINGTTFTPFNYTGRDYSVGWLSPYIYQISGNHFGHHIKPNGSPLQPQQGYQYYKMTFNRPSTACTITSATLRFKHIGIDDHITQIFVNGTSIPIPAISIFSNNNVNIPVTQGLITSGVNTIVIEVKNDGDWTGIEINGDLFIESCGFVDFTLNDKDGNEKEEFCLEEDVYMNGTIAGATNYLMDLWEVNGSNVTWISNQSATGYLPGNPSHINITDLFENVQQNSVVFKTQPNKTYRVKLAINSLCGWIELVKNFHFICCDKSADASFSLLSGSSPKLKGKSMTAGSHNWTIYGISPHTGEFISRDPIKQYTKPLFLMNEGATDCYFVKHTVSNDCGYSCSSQKSCNFSCPAKECNISPPKNLAYDKNSKFLSWSAVPGAYGYVIQVFKNGCCGPPVAISIDDLVSIPVPDNSPYFMDLFGVPQDEPAECYLIYVYAKCPDGSLSIASTICAFP